MSLFRLLSPLVAVLAGLNSALTATRERVHNLGVFKAVGMTLRQAVTMVICWVIAPAIFAAVINLPAGLITEGAPVRHPAANAGMIQKPASFVHVLSAADLALAGLAIAIAGALGPAT